MYCFAIILGLSLDYKIILECKGYFEIVSGLFENFEIKDDFAKKCTRL